MDIDAIARLLDIPKSTLRFWEKKGLISAKRGENNYRYYDDRYVVDVSDILLLRKMDVSINEISRLKTMEASELEDFYDCLLYDIEEKIAAFHRTERFIEKRRKLLYQIQKLQNNPYVVVCFGELAIPESIVKFDTYNPQAVSTYLENPFSGQYCLYFDRDASCNDYEEGWILQDGDMSAESLWAPQEEDKHKHYLRCLLVGDGYTNRKNNLSEHLQYMKRNGMAPGRIVARYLHDAYSKEEQKTVSYYCAYIEMM